MFETSIVGGASRFSALLLRRMMRTSCPVASRKVSGLSANTELLRINDSVQSAISEGKPVVALESTLIAHGMPYPENWQLSKKLATLLRSRGVEPATIALKDGVCRVGLAPEELEDLARAGTEGRAQKCSTREIPLFLAKMGRKNAPQLQVSNKSQWGATTVASTMKLAHLAGISTFVTGGIGGVHRHGEVTMDVSADLAELSRTPVIVVSAGIKSILDIPKTLEVLETNGVPTVAYRTDEFPAFFSPQSGVSAPFRMDEASEIAAAYLAAQDLGLSHGMLVAVPNDDPAGSNVEEAIQTALTEANGQNICGPAVTPFILKRVAELTGGDSLKSNMALVEQNVIVGADIAIEIAKHQRQVRSQVADISCETELKSRVIVMGGAVLDIVAKPLDRLEMATSFPASCKESDGGVARNIAEVLGRLGSKPLLYSAVGEDSRGISMLDHLSNECGISSVKKTVAAIEGANTATYIAVLDENGDLVTACADMNVLAKIQPPPQEVLQQAEILVMDANAPVEAMHQTALFARRSGVKVFLEPTSVPKALKVAADASLMSCLTFCSPNIDELSAMADGWSTTPDDHDILLYDEELPLVKPLAQRVLERMNPQEAHLLVTCGSKGVLLASKFSEAGEIEFRRFPVPKGIAVENTTGAGDTLAGAFVHGVLNGMTIAEAVSAGIDAAKQSLQCSERTIAPTLSEM